VQELKFPAPVLFRICAVARSIGADRKNFSAEGHYFEISGRFREAILARIDRLERDAAEDARVIPSLLSAGHQVRQAQLVALQIEEAVRLRARLTFSNVTVQSVHDVLCQGKEVPQVRRESV